MLSKVAPNNSINNVLFVVRVFDSEGSVENMETFFSALVSSGACVVGYNMISSILSNGGGKEALIKVLENLRTGTSKQIFNSILEGYKTTIGGMVDQVRKARLIKLITWMGGIYHGELRTDTTYLISSITTNMKYHAAVEHSQNIMKPEWIETLWRESVIVARTGSSLDKNVVREITEDQRLPVFHSCCICVTGFGSPDSNIRREMKQLVEDNGGIFMEELKATCTHLICEAAKGKKYEYVLGMNQKGTLSRPIKVLSHDWIDASLKLRAQANDSLYTITEGVAYRPPSQTVVVEGQSNEILVTTPFVSLEDIRSWLKIHLPVESKSRGRYLDGCCIHIAGFPQGNVVSQLGARLGRLVVAASGERRDSLTSDVTHVVLVTGTAAPRTLYDEVRPLFTVEQQPQCLSIRWLLNSALQHRRLPETLYKLGQTARNSSAITSINKFVGNRGGQKRHFSRSSSTNAMPAYANDEIENVDEKSLHGITDGLISDTLRKTPEHSILFADMDVMISYEFSLIDRSHLSRVVRACGGNVVSSVRRNGSFKYSECHNVAVLPLVSTSVMERIPNVLYATHWWLLACAERAERVACSTHPLFEPRSSARFPGRRIRTLVGAQELLQPCLTGYNSVVEAWAVRTLVTDIGGLLRDNKLYANTTHLICRPLDTMERLTSSDTDLVPGPKATAARKCGIPLVSSAWLIRCAMEGCFLDVTPESNETISPTNEHRPSSCAEQEDICIKRDIPSFNFARPRVPIIETHIGSDANNDDLSSSSIQQTIKLTTSSPIQSTQVAIIPPSNVTVECDKIQDHDEALPVVPAMVPAFKRRNDNAKALEIINELSKVRAEGTAMKSTVRLGSRTNSLAAPPSVVSSKTHSVTSTSSGVGDSDALSAMHFDSFLEEQNALNTEMSQSGVVTYDDPGRGDSVTLWAKLNASGIPRTVATDEIEEKTNAATELPRPVGRRRRIATVKNVCSVEHPIFLISSLHPDVREQMLVHIRALGAEVIEIKHFDPRCSHVIAGQPTRSEKYLGAVATGKWIVTADYVHASIAQGHFVSEEAYEWRTPDLMDTAKFIPGGAGNAGEMREKTVTRALVERIIDNDQRTHDLISGAQRWRKLLSASGPHDNNDGTNLRKKGAFSGWRVALVAHGSRLVGLQRLLEAGGAVVVEFKEALCNSQLKGTTSLTHFFVDVSLVNRQGAPLFNSESIWRHGTPVLDAEFIADYLFTDPPTPIHVWFYNKPVDIPDSSTPRTPLVVHENDTSICNGPPPPKRQRSRLSTKS